MPALLQSGMAGEVPGAAFLSALGCQRMVQTQCLRDRKGGTREAENRRERQTSLARGKTQPQFGTLRVMSRRLPSPVPPPMTSRLVSVSDCPQ